MGCECTIGRPQGSPPGLISSKKNWFFVLKSDSMQYNLFDFLRSISDPRRGQGQRFSLEAVLGIIIMAILSGATGLRGIERFAKVNKSDLVDIFGFKHGVPTFGTFRSILSALDPQKLAASFQEWMSTYAGMDEVYALDGKVMRSTVVHPNDELHDFVNIVSLFGHKSGLVQAFEPFHIQAMREDNALRQLVDKLNLTGVTFTMDAAHTQKNFCLDS